MDWEREQCKSCDRVATHLIRPVYARGRIRPRMICQEANDRHGPPTHCQECAEDVVASCNG